MEIHLQIWLKHKDTFLVVLSGILMGFAFPPLRFYLFSFVGLIPLFWVINKRNSLLEINKAMYVFAFIFNLITLYWVGSWTEEADKFLMISGVVLMFFNPILFLIPSTIYYFIQKKIGKTYAFYLLPFFWVSFEYLYTVTEFRFPWLLIGNSLAFFSSFIQIADIIGTFGLSLVVLLSNSIFFLIYYDYQKNREVDIKRLILPLVFYLFTIGYSYYTENKNYDTSKKIKVGLIQPNLNPWEKWAGKNVSEQVEEYLSLSKSAVKKEAKLIIWPESALPVYLSSNKYRNEKRRIHKFTDTNKIFILTGMPDFNLYSGNEAPQFAKKIENTGLSFTSFNSAYLFSPQKREVQEYHKTMLVPFGEKIPYVEYLPLLGDLFKWEVGISSWNIGDGAKNFEIIRENDTISVGTAICIESIYPNYIAEFTKLGAEFLVVITNDSWYGYSSGPFQHQAFSVLRAIENRKYIVRVANGGISTVINPKGETLRISELFTKDVLTAKIFTNKRQTIFVQFPMMIPLLSLSITFLAIIFTLFGKTIINKNSFEENYEKN